MELKPQVRNDWESKPYWKRVLIGVDQLFNAILMGNPDETMSGRMGERIYTGKATKAEIILCKILSVVMFENKHCLSSMEIDEADAEVVEKWMNHKS